MTFPAVAQIELGPLMSIRRGPGREPLEEREESARTSRDPPLLMGSTCQDKPALGQMRPHKYSACILMPPLDWHSS